MFCAREQTLLSFSLVQRERTGTFLRLDAHDEAATQNLLGDEDLIAKARLLVGDAVDDEVDAGVHVREQGRVQVDGQRETIVAIGD